MFFSGIGTATPPRRYSKAECWSAFRESEWFARLDRRSHAIAEAVLLRDNGISTRSLALESLAEVFAIDPVVAPQVCDACAALATEAAVAAMRDAGIGAKRPRCSRGQPVLAISVQASRAISPKAWVCVQTCRPSTW
jgi:alkylresorcinol/alkylpyrone synthase